MRNKLNFYLMLSIFFACSFVLNPDKFCAAQTLRTETLASLDKKRAESNESDDIIRIETNLIINDVMVFDKEGKPVKNLKMSDFIVRENGQPQEISTFSYGDNE